MKPYELRNMEIQHAIYNAEPKRVIDNFLFDKYSAQFRAVASEATKRAEEWLVLIDTKETKGGK